MSTLPVSQETRKSINLVLQQARQRINTLEEIEQTEKQAGFFDEAEATRKMINSTADSVAYMEKL